MYTKKENLEVVVKTNLMGGKGDIVCRNFLKTEDAVGAGRMFSIVTIQPGDSIGYHRHEGEYEVYYVLEGTAKIVDDGEEYLLHAEDMMQCKNGSSHSVENVGDGPLKMVALILFVKP